MPYALSGHSSTLRLVLSGLLLFFTTMAYASADSVQHRVLLLGDGGAAEGKHNAVFEAAARTVAAGDSAATIVILGNNIFPSGLPDEDDAGYDRAVEILKAQLRPFKDHKAQVFVLPGNRDWQNNGPDGLKQAARQAAFTDSLHWGNIHFLPADGCPGPEEIDLGPDIVLILMDSEWWLFPFDKTGEGSDCDCKTEDEVLVKLQDIAYRNRHKRILVAFHHPLYSGGVHGGYFTWKQHLFPLTDAHPALYLPLPLVGSLYPLIRGTFGGQQDLRYPAYRHMAEAVTDALSAAPDVLFAGAHDHSLQLWNKDNRTYIVSGSGSTTDRVSRNGPVFAAEEPGFAEVRFLEGGGRQIGFYTTAAADAQPTLAFRYEPPAPVPIRDETLPGGAPADLTATSITVAVAPAYDSASRLHRFLFGENYRKIWAMPVSLPVFYLDKEKGGLKVLQRGGGMQTKSLRLQDASGREWVLRTVQKDPSKTLNANLRQTIAKDVLQDEISSANPYAPLALPPMAEAIGLPHANPMLVWVPDDPALGIYRRSFANTVCLFEEREPGADANDKTYSTPKVLDKLEEDQDYFIDQKAVVRARLFDLMIGDWDRHEDQWRWGKEETGDSTVFYPVPRDRDQAFYINSGVLPWIAARKWLIPKFQGFKDYVPDVNGFMFNGRYFDRFFLQALQAQDFRDAAVYIQAQLPDSLIESSVRRLPAPVFAARGAEIIRKLKARRDLLPQEALKYYRFLAQAVDIPGSDKRDYFQVEHLPGGDLRVTLTKIRKDGSLEEQPYYRRSFRPGITREIRLYGRDGRDVFSVTGTEATPIKLRMIGGSGADSFYVSPGLGHRRRTVIYDRSDKPNEYPEPGTYLSRTAGNKEVNEYNGRSFRYDKLMPTGTLRYNVDDGVLLGVGLRYTTQGFRKEPYATDQQLLIGHSLSTDASFLRYNGDFKKLIGANDLNVALDAFAPDNNRNFFGIGNETVYDDAAHEIRYFRTRYNLINAQVRLQRPLTRALNVFAGLTGEFYQMGTEDNQGRFIIDYQDALAEQHIFSNKLFAGITAGFTLDTRNSKLNPTRGLYWQTTLNALHQIGDAAGMQQISSAATLYASLRQNPNFVLVNRIGGGLSLDDPYFFQLQYLGGSQNLRGYHNYRFAGQRMLYHNIEARIKLFDFASYLFPATLGVTVFNDVGRVWADHESSGSWHDGYGGGFYLIPAQAVYLGASVAHSPEGTLPYFVFSFNL